MKEMKQTEVSEEEASSSFHVWRIVCVELGIDLVGRDLAQLRRDAKDSVDEKGDRRRDYRFQSFKDGEEQSTFVIAPTEGLRDFQRRRIRRAS